MDWEFFLRSAWLFVVGVAVAVVGVYTLLAVPAIGSGSFVVMLVGLFFTGTGSIYGKRKLRGDIGMAPEERSIRRFAKEKPKPMERPAESEETEEFLEEAEQAEEQRVEAPRIEARPVLPQEPAVEEQVKVVKVLVCPKCGAENQESDTFCYHCGKKLRLKGFPEEKSKGKKAKTESKKF